MSREARVNEYRRMVAHREAARVLSAHFRTKPNSGMIAHSTFNTLSFNLSSMRKAMCFLFVPAKRREERAIKSRLGNIIKHARPRYRHRVEIGVPGGKKTGSGAGARLEITVGHMWNINIWQPFYSKPTLNYNDAVLIRVEEYNINEPEIRLFLGDFFYYSTGEVHQYYIGYADIKGDILASIEKTVRKAVEEVKHKIADKVQKGMET